MRRRSANELDWNNLLEEIEGLGKAAERELRNHLTMLLAYLLKWKLQPTRRSRSWVLTIREQRQQIKNLLADSPSLKPAVSRLMEKAYKSAVNAAADETGLADSVFASSLRLRSGHDPSRRVGAGLTLRLRRPQPHPPPAHPRDRLQRGGLEADNLVAGRDAQLVLR